MPGLLTRITQGQVLIADGAMGTMLMQRGLKSGECPEAMNLTHPEVLEAIAREYLEAGADIIQTNTFGGSPLKLASYSLEDQTEVINQNAVKAVRRAVGTRAYISASCGPCGKLLKPYGDTDPQIVSASFERQLAALSAGGIDIICIETMIALEEIKLAIAAAKKVDPDIPVMATMTFDATPRGFYTTMGVNIEKAAQELEAAGADLVGSNCGNGMDNMLKIAAEFKRYTRLPLVIQANAGLPELKDNQLVYPESAEYMAVKVRELAKMGVAVIGGCCGTTPEYIQAFKSAVRG